jgi:hypothetical protein
MKFSQIKQVVEFCNDLFSTPDWREVVEQVEAGEDDFEVDNVRFIKSSEIDAVLASELESDEYVLGCFNAGFIQSVTGWPIALIEAAQKGDAYAALGQAIISEGYAESMAESYASADGYGHHFNGYDGSEEEVVLNGTTYHVFDNH